MPDASPQTDTLTDRLRAHPYFTESVDASNDVRSFVLTERVGVYHKAAYFVSPTAIDSGGWLWFYAADPPSRQWQVAAVSLDPDQPQIRRFPGALANGNPLVIGDGSAAYLAIEDGVYRQAADGAIEEVFRIPPDMLANRHLYRLCTEITMLADGSAFLMDSQIGNQHIIWLADAATGEPTILRKFDKKHHHTIASPHDPELFMVSQGPGRDPHTGDKIDMDIRIWLMDTKGTRFEPLQADMWFGHNSMACHEWWTPEGKVQFCEYGSGIWETDPALPHTQRGRELVWERPLIHGQVDPTGRYLCGDFNPYRWNDAEPCSVWMFDRQTQNEIAVAHQLPEPPIGHRDRRAYHTDPHPHFSGDGRLLIYTTTVLGDLDLAITPVGPVAEQLD